MTFIADAGRMNGLVYPKQDWRCDEEYLVYKVGERIDGKIDLRGILERQTEAWDGRPVFVYFEEVDYVRLTANSQLIPHHINDTNP